MQSETQFNKYMPIALLYFFFNGFLLPLGLLYTTFLTPFFLIWLWRYPSFNKVFWFFLLFAPFLVVQLANGVEPLVYGRSAFLLFSVFVFGLAFYQFLKNCHTLRSIYRNILYFNAIMVVLALIALAIPPARKLFWYANEITAGVHTVRLRLLTYEPSYYATLLIPIAVYYYLKLIVLKVPDPLTTFVLVTVPFLLALSFGGILGLALALLFTVLYGYRRFFEKNTVLYVLLGGIFVLIVLGIVCLVFPNNILVVRIANIFNGRDTSFRGRTYESLELGWRIADLKSIWFGCGPGQAKEIGLEVFRHFYHSNRPTKEWVVIPNAVGDTLVNFGILGVSLRLFLQFFFFFRTKTYTNYYRFALFLFIFIYQFTGSFLTNIAEYVIWVMAFYPGLFPEFDKVRFSRRRFRTVNTSPSKELSQ